MKLLPTDMVSPKGKILEDFLKCRVKGQERAVRYLREYMEIYWANLHNPGRPIGNFLFIGPSGVGKTELAKSLAEYMFGKQNRLTIIDCSEYSEGHEISDLIGAAPNYVGHGTSTPKLTQWNIDKYHVEQLCDSGEFFDEFIAEQEKDIAIYEDIKKDFEKECAELKKQINDYLRDIKKLENGYLQVDDKVKKGQDTPENAQNIREILEKELDNVLQSLKAAKIELEANQKEIAGIEQDIEEIKEKIEDWKKLKEKTSKDRIRAFLEIVNSGKYTHKVGRYSSVILWDEIEKASPKLFNLLLPIMDRGKIQLHDPPDKETIFTNTINIFTSNLGSDKIAESFAEISNEGLNSRIGFHKANRSVSQEELKKLDKQIYEMIKVELRRSFRPEFIGRINKLIVFRPLDEKTMREIIDLRINERVKRQPVKFEIHPEVKDYLSLEAMKDMSSGARLLDDRIRQFIDSQIAPLINAGLLKSGDTVIVKLGKDKKLEFYKK